MKNTKIYKVHLPEAQEMINDKNNEINNTNQINLCAISTFAWRSLESAWRLDAMVEKSSRNCSRNYPRVIAPCCEPA